MGTKKSSADWLIVANIILNEQYCLLKLSLGRELPEILPGQFVQVLVDNSPRVFLRRPISVHQVDREKQELHLLVQVVGEGTRLMSLLKPGNTVNLLFPLGNSFTIPDDKTKKLLLIGGGVGVAPLLYLGKCLKENGFSPVFLLGARTAKDLLRLDEFEKYGAVYTTTEDGSAGEKGFVTNHSLLLCGDAGFIYTCGPKAMMVAVARYAREYHIPCEVSLENLMACGIGACLCCVEKTTRGNVCVCTEGPVFNINDLTWLI